MIRYVTEITACFTLCVDRKQIKDNSLRLWSKVLTILLPSLWHDFNSRKVSNFVRRRKNVWFFT